MRDGDTVEHYRIQHLDEGGFFIARRITFRTLQELVEHYSRDADDLCVNLEMPCVKTEKPVTGDRCQQQQLKQTELRATEKATPSEPRMGPKAVKVAEGTPIPRLIRPTTRCPPWPSGPRT